MAAFLSMLGSWFVSFVFSTQGKALEQKIERNVIMLGNRNHPLLQLLLGGSSTTPATPSSPSTPATPAAPSTTAAHPLIEGLLSLLPQLVTDFETSQVQSALTTAGVPATFLASMSAIVGIVKSIEANAAVAPATPAVIVPAAPVSVGS